MKPMPLVIALLLLCSSFTNLYAQDQPFVPDADKITGKYLDAVTGKSATISRDIDRQTEKYLSKFQREENRIRKRLAKKDSSAAAKVFANSSQQYAALQQKITAKSQQLVSKGRHYIPILDTLATSLKFFRQYGDLFKKGMASSRQLNSTLSQVNTMQDKMQQADEVQDFIKDRRQQLTDQLQQLGMGDAMKQFNKDAYYYGAQLSEYRAALSDPDKAEQKALALLNQLPVFQQFMMQNSMLASLFGAPGSSTATATAMQGLQTRAQVQQLVQGQLAAGGPNAQAMVQQNIQEAQSQLNALKDKIGKLGGNNGDMEIPDFKPNQQKTKTFLQRIEYGTNIQTQKSGSFFPATTDLALSAGYKLNDKNTIGIGASYKLGWGKDVQHMALSNEGIGFRSFADMKLKGTFYVSGSFEYNYQQAFASLQQINSLNSWSQSGLVGISKIISIKSKPFKKTKLQLLWDFLSYQQKPITQPIKFRVGYNF